jgi:cation:H+ antiporter
MLNDILLLIGGVLMLTGGAECLVRGSVALATRLGVSSFFIGLTLVGFGTSTPELATSVQAALNGLADVNLGNVVGSNIFNLALILGVASLIMPIPVDTQVVRKEVWVVIAVAFLPFTALITGGQITPYHGVTFLVLLAMYLFVGYRRGMQESPALAKFCLRRNMRPWAATWCW